MDITIDQMQADDWDAVRRIYLDGLATGNASFETEPRAWKCGTRSTTSTAGSWPARAGASWHGRRSRRSPRPCYAGVAEVSLYVSDDCRGRGVGTKLLKP